MGNENSSNREGAKGQGSFPGSSVDPPRNSQENVCITVSRNDPPKTLSDDSTKRDICLKENALSTASRSSDSMKDETDSCSKDVSMQNKGSNENGLSSTGPVSNTKTRKTEIDDKLQKNDMKEKISLVTSTSLHSVDAKETANKSRKQKDIDVLNLSTHVSTATPIETTTENFGGHLKDEHDECIQNDEFSIKIPVNTPESHSKLPNTSDKSKSQNDKDIDKTSLADNQNQSDQEVYEVDGEPGVKKSEEQDSTVETVIQKLVQRCFESVDNLEKEQLEILDLVNKRSSSDSEIQGEGAKVIAELEGIVKKFVDRRKEKDEAIAQLTSILDKLTDNVKMMEQEIQTLESAGGNGPECREQNGKQMSGSTKTDEAVARHSMSENFVEQSNDKFVRNSDPLNPSSVNPNGEKEAGDSRQTSPTVEKDLTSQDIDDKDEDKVPQHITLNETNEDSLSSSPSHNTDQSITIDKRNHEHQGMDQRNEIEGQSNSVDDHMHRSENKSTASVENSVVQESGSVSETYSNAGAISGQENESGTHEYTSNIPRESLSERNQRNITAQQRGSEPSTSTDTPNIICNQNMSKKTTHMRTLPPEYWTEKANEILAMMSLEGPIDNECGLCSVLCLDTSDSMWGEPFLLMKNLALRFISGVENSSLTEKVGLVCFGEDTRVISRCCTNYHMLRREIQNLNPAGPSPLTAGLMLSLSLVRGGVTTPRDQQGITYNPRIIVLTDGKATPELTTGNGDFIPDAQDRLMINSDMDGMTRHFRKSANRVYCVSLGQGDESLIRPLVRRTGGKFIKPEDFDKLIYQFEGEILASSIRHKFPNFRQVEPSLVRQAVQADNHLLRGINMDDLVEFVRNPPPQREIVSDDDNDDDDDDNDENSGNRESNADMPPIGTRVRRGPDWDPKFGEQDSHGPGTVVSHGRNGYIWVIWDNGHRNVYPYGMMGGFAVMVVEEPRVLQHDQFIEVGCLVKRGDNWRDDDLDGGPGSIGVVFRVHSDLTVGVRWPNGLLRRYKYGKQGYMEVQLCDPFDEEVKRQRSSKNYQASFDKDNTPQSKRKDSGQLRIEDIINSDERNDNAIEEMNRKNALQFSQLVDQVDTDSGGHQVVASDDQTGQNETNNVNHAGPLKSQNDDMNTTSTSNSNMNNGQLKQPIQQADESGNEESFKETKRNNPISERKELSSPDPNLGECLSMRVDNEKTSASPDVRDTNSQNPDKAVLSRSSSSDISYGSDLSFDMEVPTIAQPTNQTNINTDQGTTEIAIWQINDRYEGWKDFPKDISNGLEKAYQKNPRGTFSYIKGNKRFQVQLSKLIHIHPVTKEMSSVRRKES